jgi:hypothetical protein
MMEVSMLQPFSTSGDAFAAGGRCKMVAEPALTDLMSDPLTEAMMAADGVDRGALIALLTQVGRNLTVPARC